MALSNRIAEVFSDSSVRVISAKYDDIKDGGLNVGFVTATVDGNEVHRITKDIVISIQRFKDGVITNLVFSEGQPLKLELQDREIIPYCSDYIELRYLISGELVLEFEEGEARFQEGDVCFIHSMSRHREIPDRSDCLFLNIGIERGLFSDYFLENVQSGPFQRFLRENILKLGKQESYVRFVPLTGQNDEILLYMNTIFYEVLQHRVGYTDICRGWLLRLMDSLTRVYRFQFSEEAPEMYYKNLFESVSQYMQENLAAVTMDDLAAEFHFHPNYFNNLIKRNTGLTYSAYLIQLRMNRAKQLLKTTDFSVEEISWLVGYHNKGFFYKRFTADCGMSPKQYRKTVRLA